MFVAGDCHDGRTVEAIKITSYYIEGLWRYQGCFLHHHHVELVHPKGHIQALIFIHRDMKGGAESVAFQVCPEGGAVSLC